MQRSVVASAAIWAVMLASAAAAPAASGPNAVRARVRAALADPRALSQGALTWLDRPVGTAVAAPLAALAAPALGSNVAANAPDQELAPGQSETAIAGQRSGTGRRLVMVDWNDASAVAL